MNSLIGMLLLFMLACGGVMAAGLALLGWLGGYQARLGRAFAVGALLGLLAPVGLCGVLLQSGGARSDAQLGMWLVLGPVLIGLALVVWAFMGFSPRETQQDETPAADAGQPKDSEP